MKELKQLFVFYPEALEMKGLGFDEPCLGLYNQIKELCYPQLNYGEWLSFYNQNEDKWIVQAPTYQQAFKWFRDKYGLRIRNYGSINYSGELSEYFEIFKYGYGTSDKSLSMEVGALTYEKAELDCLRKLIEIAKGK